MGIVGSLFSGGGFEVYVAALRFKNAHDLPVHKKEIVGLAISVKKPFDKRNGVVVISHAAPIGDMPTRIDKLLVDLDSCVFFRLQFVHPTSRFDAADRPVNVQPVTSASTAYFVTNYIKIGDVQGIFGL